MATAGSDYAATSGTLTFAPDDTSKQVRVTVKDDSIQDSGEAFELVLENPTGGAQLSENKKRATGTIEDADRGGLEASFPENLAVAQRRRRPPAGNRGVQRSGRSIQQGHALRAGRQRDDRVGAGPHRRRPTDLSQFATELPPSPEAPQHSMAVFRQLLPLSLLTPVKL